MSPCCAPSRGSDGVGRPASVAPLGRRPLGDVSGHATRGQSPPWLAPVDAEERVRHHVAQSAPQVLQLLPSAGAQLAGRIELIDERDGELSDVSHIWYGTAHSHGPLRLTGCFLHFHVSVMQSTVQCIASLEMARIYRDRDYYITIFIIKQ